jgi:hypothetical protein
MSALTRRYTSPALRRRTLRRGQAAFLTENALKIVFGAAIVLCTLWLSWSLIGSLSEKKQDHDARKTVELVAQRIEEVRATKTGTSTMVIQMWGEKPPRFLFAFNKNEEKVTASMPYVDNVGLAVSFFGVTTAHSFQDVVFTRPGRTNGCTGDGSCLCAYAYTGGRERKATDMELLSCTTIAVDTLTTTTLPSGPLTRSVRYIGGARPVTVLIEASENTARVTRAS